ncbi:MAG: DegT/DnrJ/EryC1/StrS family aminotransferase [Cytophagales bacterium]|nr:DegT/DnrJ/EryC1/StrS family aminotransferase [Cytophagales bacterium]
MIPVTKPFFPNSDAYKRYIDQIWANEWITNNGYFVKKFESELGKELNTQNPILVSNGTIAIQMCIKALNLTGEIITTPFTYVATTSSIVWENCKPVFADIDENTLNIDPSKVESLVSGKTSAIIATHCFGNACDIEALVSICDKHGIALIFDAAHCFGTLYNGKSIFEFGDLSTCSLHATKLMHCGEGGLIFSNNTDKYEQLKYIRNFGHDGPENFHGLGINGKTSELHAALGLCVLEELPAILSSRKKQSEIYDDLLQGLEVTRPIVSAKCEPNYSYYPIIFPTMEACLKARDLLADSGIQARRYFFPSLNKLNYIEAQEVPSSESISSRILSLPLYFNLPFEIQKQIAGTLMSM